MGPGPAIVGFCPNHPAFSSGCHHRPLAPAARLGRARTAHGNRLHSSRSVCGGSRPQPVPGADGRTPPALASPAPGLEYLFVQPAAGNRRGAGCRSHPGGRRRLRPRSREILRGDCGRKPQRTLEPGSGHPGAQGPSLQFFVQVAGERVSNPPTSDLFEGIDTTWGRVEGAARLGRLFSQARRELVPDQPEKILPLLVAAYTEMERLHDPWVDVKRPELLHAIDLAAGLWLDAEADRWNVVPGSSLDLTLTAINRSHFPLTWERTEIKGVAGQTSAAPNRPLEFNNPQQFKATVTVPPNAPFSQPYWMRELRTADYYPVSDPNLIGMPENPPVLEATFYLRTAQGVVLPMRAPVQYRWIERAGGEKVRAVEVVPPVAVSFTSPAMVFPEARPRPVIVRLSSSVKQAKGTVSLAAPVGWKVAPAAAPFEISDPNQQLGVRFEVTPPARAGGGHMTARAQIGGTTVSAGMVSIQYPHIPPQTYFPPARTRVERFDVRLTAKNIG